MENTENNTENEKGVDLPDYLRRWPGLYIIKGDRIVEAAEEDTAIARSYPTYKRKGPIVDGKRLTILTKKLTYRVGEEIRILHIAEVIEPGHMVYVMGPKKIYGEYLDGKRITDPLPIRNDPLVPEIYDGAVLPSPAVDYNYEITSYSFSEPGTHSFQWRLGPLESNVLTLDVTEVPSAEKTR